MPSCTPNRIQLSHGIMVRKQTARPSEEDASVEEYDADNNNNAGRYDGPEQDGSASMHKELLSAIAGSDHPHGDILLLVTAFSELCRTVRFVRSRSSMMPASEAWRAQHPTARSDPVAFDSQADEQAATQDDRAEHMEEYDDYDDDYDEPDGSPVHDHYAPTAMQNYATGMNTAQTTQAHPSAWRRPSKALRIIDPNTGLPIESVQAGEASPASAADADETTRLRSTSWSRPSKAIRIVDPNTGRVINSPQSSSSAQDKSEAEQEQPTREHEEELDAFHANKDHDPRVPLDDTTRPALEPISNSVAARSKPTMNGHHTMNAATTPDVKPSPEAADANAASAAIDRRDSLLNGQSVSTGDLRQRSMPSTVMQLYNGYSAIVAQPHVFDGTPAQETPLSSNHLEEDRRANEDIMSRFPGLRLSEDLPSDGFAIGTDQQQPSQHADGSMQAEEEPPADASYCGTDGCGYCPSPGIAATTSTQNNGTFPPPLPEFFQTATSADPNVFTALEEGGIESDRQEEEEEEEAESEAGNEDEEDEQLQRSFANGLDSKHLSQHQHSYHLSSPVLSTTHGGHVAETHGGHHAYGRA
ncbi:hypothetical protein SYNPS1DRAFT_30255 [Syncephalis pseudoplumigaleata]|uniref:Uncharacterized protein n=1 Tax=Syncephalis pseudoplumigaleata TaxID=1712513 RepID=A0A4P9YXC1_9FUNG|nr:hypothetical protein SYNPS1DRAFT_30255 [Syncephalis pseudoplumigaleata]|eukprot:RKP23971.1 hypothetical protein SYNPS1DRAFT_30255 [Syncephalis pseudoplumigaleata]